MMMGSTPDIANSDLIEQCLDRVHSLSSLENGIPQDETRILNAKEEQEEEDGTNEKREEVVGREESNDSIISVTPIISDKKNAIFSPKSTADSQAQKSLLPSSDNVSSDNPNHPNHHHPQRTLGPAGTAIKPMACEMCNNYEIQLQEVQYKEGVLGLQISAHEKTIKQLKEELKKEQKFRHELEEKYNEQAKISETETAALSMRVDEGAKRMAIMSRHVEKFEKRSNELVQELITQVETLKRDLQRATHENEILLGKTVAKSQELLAEHINLPQAADDMQLYCLQLREDWIQATVAKEHIEEQLKSENLFIKERLRDEQQSKEKLEENFSQEIELLNSMIESKDIELSEKRKQYAEMADELESLRSDYNKLSTGSVSRIAELEKQCKDLSAYKQKAEIDLQQLRGKVVTMQTDLENNEATQRDFVKLSQTLQVELEKFRQSDNEVRWQHEDDVTECNACKKAFHSKKEKTNCKHCGRIFCADCSAKIVYGGPKNRPNHVCNVCHTLLNKQSACWFVDEPPQSPT